MRLRDQISGVVTFCRTYELSSRAIATGDLTQSTRFDAGHLPFGRYDLCVVANGISSHCVDFCHLPPQSCCCGHGDPCEQCETRWMRGAAEHEVTRLHEQIRGLRESVRRFSGQEQPPEERQKKRPVNKPEAASRRGTKAES